MSVIDRRTVGRFASTLSPLVKKLAEKNPVLAAQSKRYSAATAEPNRWMQRYAKQQVENLGREYPLASTLLTRKMKPESTVRLATIPDAAHVLVPLISMPVIDSDGPAVEKAFWRVDLQPQWVAHRLFFAKAQ